MMRQYELVERVVGYDPDADEDMLNRAYIYAMKAHGTQTRASGEAYFNNPLEVAAILADMKLDTATIVAALLHDTVEDTEATHQEIVEKFGEEIASLVDGLTKIAKLDMVTKEATQAENLRKLLLAMSKDVRVLLVKLADRLHNMRTLNHVKPEKRARVAQETMDIYAPLAGRMGILRLHPLAQCELARRPPRFLDALFGQGFKTRVSERLGEALAERIVAGGYPAAPARRLPARRAAWYRDYVESQVQRDARYR